MYLAPESTEATVVRLRLISRDADSKAHEFRNADKPQDAAFYAGMRAGLLRAVSVVEGRG